MFYVGGVLEDRVFLDKDSSITVIDDPAIYTREDIYESDFMADLLLLFDPEEFLDIAFNDPTDKRTIYNLTDVAFSEFMDHYELALQEEVQFMCFDNIDEAIELLDELSEELEYLEENYEETDSTRFNGVMEYQVWTKKEH